VAVAERAGRATLEAVGRDPDQHEVGLLLCDDARMAILNERFRGRKAPTNVLSWPAFPDEVPVPAGVPGEGPTFIGDIALGYETCAREAAAAGITLADHAAHLLVHGVLHLLGHDHQDEAEAETMEALESRVLSGMGIADPYASPG
jgi:probable rRNA maturation factor